MVRALSAGKLSCYMEGAQVSGVWTSLLVEHEGPKQDLSQKLCCFGLSQKLRQRPHGPGIHLSSGREGGRMSGALKGRCLRSSVAPACSRSCQLLCAHSHLCRLLTPHSSRDFTIYLFFLKTLSQSIVQPILTYP